MTASGQDVKAVEDDASSTILQFAPLPTVIAPDFWHSLSTLKLDRLRLSDERVFLRAGYGPARRVRDRQSGEELRIQGGLTLDQESLLEPNSEAVSPAIGKNSNRSSVVTARGTLLNYNTAVQFTSSDKNALFNELAKGILEDLLASPEPLEAVTRFMLLTYADLKKYKFFHWAAAPGLVAQAAWRLTNPGWTVIEADDKLRTAAGPLARHLETHRGKAEAGFCLLKFDASEQDDQVPTLGRVVDYDDFFVGVPQDERVVVFVDPSSHPSAAGWPLRNLLALLSVRFNVRAIKILCWRDELEATATLNSSSASLFGSVFQPDASPGAQGFSHSDAGELRLASTSDREALPFPAAIGWERNAQGKLGPKVADLGPLMDPKRLADQAVDLNLKLMRWRIMPDIQLEKIASTRCLLLGAGTLGCYVARVLLGWGVRTITLVDNGRVSYSNPVRQPLFDFEDCVNGGKPKAQCAADKLVKIFPGVNTRGVSLSIPMPGHSLLGSSGSLESVRKDVEQLEQLYDEHDAVFLLMDSRESRWLPTLLGAAKDRTVVNAALGFDSYLVMRHGAGPQERRDDPQSQNEHENAEPELTNSHSSENPSTSPYTPARLGCYFCNDVVAPTDSLTDRTLDQMCTVTRPGLAAIAGASAVELLVSLLHHKDGKRAPAPVPAGRADRLGGDDAATATDSSHHQSGSPLGSLPHQIRGFLSSYSNKLVTGAAFDKCTACSERVVEAYRSQGWDMLRRALGDDPPDAAEVQAGLAAGEKRYGYLERLTGLDELYRQTEKMLEEDGTVEVWNSSDDDDGDDDASTSGAS
ncbi:unnamed protein product [Parajaminaea phylloscopi]